PSPMTTIPTEAPTSALANHIAIARIDYWFKNVFVLPGIVIALSTVPRVDARTVTKRAIIGLIAICLIASSNYTLNEILDANTDRFHPVKHSRPIASGRVSKGAAYVQWLMLFAVGMAIALRVSRPFAFSLLALWTMACVYNVPPVRAKDQPYVDVLSEAINNPLRLVAGWFMVTDATRAP